MAVTERPETLRRAFFGRKWRATVAGAALILCYEFAMLALGVIGINLGTPALFVNAFVGGLGAGTLQRSYWLDGAAMGAWARFLGMSAVSVLVAVGAGVGGPSATCSVRASTSDWP